MPKKLKKKQKITHQDVSAAIATFEAKGGIIHKLPEHQTIKRPIIGQDKHNNFESLSSFIPW